MEHSTNEVNQAGATSEDCTDATISPDEYDEDLGFPDDDMTMVTLGNILEIFKGSMSIFFNFFKAR
jgi:hypothetical protein